MKRGYVGQRTKKRKRNRFLFLFFILLIGTSIFFVYSSENVDEEIVTIEKIDTEKENTVSINNLKNKLFETENRLSLRQDLLNSLKKKIKVLEDNNRDFINNVQLLNLEKSQGDQENIKSQKKYRLEIKQLQKTINQLNQEIKLVDNNYLSIQKKNVSIKNEMDILKNNNSTLELQKKIAFKKIEELNKMIIEKDKMIIEKDKLVKQMKDKFHH